MLHLCHYRIKSKLSSKFKKETLYNYKNVIHLCHYHIKAKLSRFWDEEIWSTLDYIEDIIFKTRLIFGFSSVTSLSWPLIINLLHWLSLVERWRTKRAHKSWLVDRNIDIIWSMEGEKWDGGALTHAGDVICLARLLQ